MSLVTSNDLFARADSIYLQLQPANWKDDSNALMSLDEQRKADIALLKSLGIKCAACSVPVTFNGVTESVADGLLIPDSLTGTSAT